MPSVEDNAYFAGLLDGEGSVNITRSHGNSRILRKQYYYPRVIITNTHKGVLDFAKTLYGGCVYQRKDMNGRKNPCYNWVLTSRLADKFLRLVLPYLVIKQEQTELVLTFYDGIYFHGNKNSNQQTKDDAITHRSLLIKQVKEFNRR